jgi:hypothetical protein
MRVVKETAAPIFHVNGFSYTEFKLIKRCVQYAIERKRLYPEYPESDTCWAKPNENEITELKYILLNMESALA